MVTTALVLCRESTLFISQLINKLLSNHSENSPKEARALILYLDGDTKLARSVDKVMAPAKRIYILIININKLFFLTPCFYRVIERLVKD